MFVFLFFPNGYHFEQFQKSKTERKKAHLSWTHRSGIRTLTIYAQKALSEKHASGSMNILKTKEKERNTDSVYRHNELLIQLSNYQMYHPRNSVLSWGLVSADK